MIELKNGETYNGKLVNIDLWMNVNLKEVIRTSRDGDEFWSVPEVYVRGNTIKYVRVPDNVLDAVAEEKQAREAAVRYHIQCIHHYLLISCIYHLFVDFNFQLFLSLDVCFARVSQYISCFCSAIVIGVRVNKVGPGLAVEVAVPVQAKEEAARVAVVRVGNNFIIADHHLPSCCLSLTFATGLRCMAPSPLWTSWKLQVDLYGVDDEDDGNFDRKLQLCVAIFLFLSDLALDPL